MEEKRPEKSGQPAEPESIYKNFAHVPIWVLDLIIGLSIAALVIVIAVGVMNR